MAATWWVGYAAAFAAALLLAWVLTPVMQRVAVRFGVLDRPGQHKSHASPVPYLGGVAMVVAFAATVMTAGAVLGPPGELGALAIILLTALALSVVGLWDDLRGAPQWVRLSAQAAAGVVVWGIGSGTSAFGPETVNAAVTVLWVVGITNAFNLLDNMDGLCAGIGIIVAGALLVGAFENGSSAQAAYLVVLMGALCGFLIYNFSPASIFMGDTGSLFVGFTLSAVALDPAAGAGGGSGLLSVMGAPVLLLLIPIFDTTLVTVLRLLSGRKPSQGGRDHSSHRLVAIGLPERTAVLVLWTLAALGALIGVELRVADSGFGLPAAAALVLAMIIFAVYLSHVRVYDESKVGLIRTGRITPFVDNLMYKRRAAEVMLDLCLVALSYHLAYRLRFEGAEYPVYFQQFLTSLPLVIAVQIVALFAVGAYRGVWRYASTVDLLNIVKAVTTAILVFLPLIFTLNRLDAVPRSVPFIQWCLLIVALGCGLLAETRATMAQTGARLGFLPGGDPCSFDAAATPVTSLTASPSCRGESTGIPGRGRASWSTPRIWRASGGATTPTAPMRCSPEWLELPTTSPPTTDDPGWSPTSPRWSG
jgi:UDP-GlcNAc:undecaprenyl-phosphate/decaprenyl-phosphate GlcNAc-1-phosphate transferase